MAAKRRAETMKENREKLIKAAREAFAKDGFAGASMDNLTAMVGLTRGALYHNFGDKKGLLAAVVTQIDGEMAQHAQQAGQQVEDGWAALLAVEMAYIERALDPEVRRIVLLDGPAFLGDPSQWPSQNACLENTKTAISELMGQGVVRQMDVEAAARLLSGAALNAALWIASSEEPSAVLPKAVAAFQFLAEGLLNKSA